MKTQWYQCKEIMIFSIFLSLAVSGNQNQGLTDCPSLEGEQNDVRDYLMIFCMLGKNDEVLGERKFEEQEKYFLLPSNHLLTPSTVDQKKMFLQTSPKITEFTCTGKVCHTLSLLSLLFSCMHFPSTVFLKNLSR